MNHGWTEHKSPDGHTYYWHKERAVSAWEKPPEMMNAAQLSAAAISTSRAAIDVDLSSFGEPLAPAAPATPLCWRDDPESSLSDWIIRVKAPGANATYHVHRATLATGVRRSEYFARLFTGAGTSGLVENVQGSSTIPLELSAANAFPAFLDFVYKGELAISDASAMALLHLAEYFLNRPLHDQVTKYVQTALKGAPGSEAGTRTARSAPLFLAEANLYALDKAAGVCARVCATHLLTRDLGYCGELAPPLYLRVVEAVECTSPEQSIALSDHVAAFVNAHSPPLARLGPLPLIDVTMLEGLTAKLTAVSADSALDLLGHALARQGAERLQSECAKTIGAKWEGGLLPTIVSSLASKDEGGASGDQGSAWTPLGAGTYPSGLQFSLLSHALVHASTELDDLRSQLAVANALNEELTELKEKARALGWRNIAAANCSFGGGSCKAKKELINLRDAVRQLCIACEEQQAHSASREVDCVPGW